VIEGSRADRLQSPRGSASNPPVYTPSKAVLAMLATQYAKACPTSESKRPTPVTQ